jgi:catechol 2,3-dioxygenase-like lactoylglutathione lyase family enzyme
VLRLGTVVIGVQDLHRAIAFYTRALEYRPRWEVGPDADFVILEGDGPDLSLDVVGSEPPEFPRVHLDLYARDAADQAAEVDRLLALGATRVDWPFCVDDPDFVVLADPEGNRFCVIDSTHDA